jgi:hypothetical protein
MKLHAGTLPKRPVHQAANHTARVPAHLVPALLGPVGRERAHDAQPDQRQGRVRARYMHTSQRTLCLPFLGRSVASVHVMPRPTSGSPSDASCAACRSAARAMAAAVSALAYAAGGGPPSASASAAGA